MYYLANPNELPDVRSSVVFQVNERVQRVCICHDVHFLKGEDRKWQSLERVYHLKMVTCISI